MSPSNIDSFNQFLEKLKKENKEKDVSITKATQIIDILSKDVRALVYFSILRRRERMYALPDLIYHAEIRFLLIDFPQYSRVCNANVSLLEPIHLRSY